MRSAIVILLHRASPSRVTSSTLGLVATDMPYPSRVIAFQAAERVTTITESLLDHNELGYVPPFMYTKLNTSDERTTNSSQCILSLFRTYHAYLRNAVHSSIDRLSHPSENKNLYGGTEDNFRSLARCKDAPFSLQYTSSGYFDRPR